MGQATGGHPKATLWQRQAKMKGVRLMPANGIGSLGIRQDGEEAALSTEMFT